MAQFRRIRLLLGVVLLVVPSTLLAQCGVERWSVKTGTDPDAGLVDLNSSTSTAITTLAALPKPSSIPANNRIAPTETTVWVINATLTKYKLEGDSDYHLVLSDAAGNTMIMEIPSPTCVGAGSPFLPGIQNARAKFDAMFTATTSFHTTSVPVQIFGVGMFDFLHGQTGVAPNGIELHPVLDLVFNPGTPTPDFTLSVSPGSVSVAQGGSGSSTISTAVSGGFNSAISLSASGLPAGVTASLTPASIAGPGSGSSTLSFTASSTAATGTSNVTVTATGGGITHTSTVALTITAAGGTTTTQVLGNPGFENGSASPAPWSATASVINNSTSEPPHSGSWDAWLDGYGTTHTDTLMQQVSIPSNATGASLSFWLHIDTAETSTTTAFDTLALQIRNSSGTVLSTLRTFSNLNKNTGFAQQTFDLTSFAGQTIQINFVGTEDSMLQTSFVLDDFALNVTTPSTTTDTTPPTTSVSSPANGATVSGTVAVNTSASDNVGVTQMQILIDGTVAASNTSATSLSFNWDTTLVPDGSHTIVSKAFDAAGNVGTSSTVTVTVSNGTTTTSELILNGGFENGTTTSPWVLTTGVINSSASEPPHTGSWDAWMNGYGTAHTDTAMQQVAIPSTATAASLSFWLHIDTAETTTTSAFDTLTVQVRDSAGNVLSTLATFSNLNHATGYQQHNFDLTAFHGQTVQIFFSGTEDSSLQTSFVLDDVSLQVTQ